MKLMNLFSRCLPDVLRRWLKPVRRPSTRRHSSQIRLETLEDRLPLSTTSLPGGTGLPNASTQPTMIVSNHDAIGGSFSEESLAFSLFSTVPATISGSAGHTSEPGLFLAQSNSASNRQAYPLLWVSLDNPDQPERREGSGMRMIPPSAHSQGVSDNPVALPNAAAVAQGIGLPESRYLLVATLFSAGPIAQPPAGNSAPAPGEEAFALFLPKAQDSTAVAHSGIEGLTGARLGPFEAIARGNKPQASAWQAEPVRQDESGRMKDEVPVQSSDTGRLDSPDVDHLEPNQESDLPGPSVERMEDEVAPVVTDQDLEVFADPSFLPPTLDWRLVVLAVALFPQGEPNDRKAKGIAL
jgi:hypothetical protein